MLDVNKENIARDIKDGKWHMMTIVYDDAFNNPQRPTLRTGSNISFYVDGLEFK